jgi:hypothetical protein
MAAVFCARLGKCPALPRARQRSRRLCPLAKEDKEDARTPLRQAAAAVFIFLTASARAGIVPTHFGGLSPHRRYHQLEFFAVGFVLIPVAHSEIFSARQRACRDPIRLSTLRALSDVERKRG